MNTRNQARERRGAVARRNAIANEIAGYCAAQKTPDPRLVEEWEAAANAVAARDRKETTP